MRVMRVPVPAFIRAHVRIIAAGVQPPRQITSGLLKRFTAKIPLCKCLIINKIKYFFKFFCVLKKYDIPLQTETRT